MDIFEQLWTSATSREIILLLIGFLSGIVIVRWRIEIKKPIVKSQLDKAQTRSTQDMHELRKIVSRLEKRLSIFNAEFNEFKQEIEEIEIYQHVPNIIGDAKHDVSKLRDDVSQ